MLNAFVTIVVHSDTGGASMQGNLSLSHECKLLHLHVSNRNPLQIVAVFKQQSHVYALYIVWKERESECKRDMIKFYDVCSSIPYTGECYVWSCGSFYCIISAGYGYVICMLE